MKKKKTLASTPTIWHMLMCRIYHNASHVWGNVCVWLMCVNRWFSEKCVYIYVDWTIRRTNTYWIVITYLLRYIFLWSVGDNNIVSQWVINTLLNFGRRDVCTDSVIMSMLIINFAWHIMAINSPDSQIIHYISRTVFLRVAA